jgi:hypothetical protein
MPSSLEDRMATFMVWCGVVGSWLLFLGPICQATMELRAHEIARDRISAVASSVRATGRVSAWWWLLPPVKIVLERRRTMRHQHALVTGLSHEDFASLLAFMNKATAWLFIACGALVLAIKDTFQVAQIHHLGVVTYVCFVLVLATSCVVICAVRIRRSDDLLAKSRSAAAKIA